MQFSCQQADLAQGLQLVSRAINNNNTLPVLNNILLETKDDKLHLAATNLEIAIKINIPAQIKEAGSLTVPAKIITSYVQLVNEKNVDLKVTRDLSLEISNNQDYTKIKGISANDFPKIPEIEPEVQLEIPEKELAQGLQLTAFAASLHSSRPVLAGVYIAVKNGKMIFAATDSYRLAEKKIDLGSAEHQEFNCVLPVRSALELAKLLSPDAKTPVKIRLTKNQIEFSAGPFTFVSRLIEGAYPDYEKIIPTEEKTNVVIARSDLVNALKKVSLFTREINNNMKVTITEKEMRLLSNETKVGEGEAKISVKREGEDNEIAVNSQFLQDVVNLLPDKELHLKINDKHLPVLIIPQKTADYLYFIMPLKV